MRKLSDITIDLFLELFAREIFLLFEIYPSKEKRKRIAVIGGYGNSQNTLNFSNSFPTILKTGHTVHYTFLYLSCCAVQ